MDEKYVTRDGKFDYHKWSRINSNILSEAPMDKRFAKEWDKSVSALLNHLKHELKKGKGVIGQTNLGMIKKMVDAVGQVKGIPSRLGKIIGEQ